MTNKTGPTEPNKKSQPDEEEREWTEEEKKLDAKYQQDRWEHKAKIMTEIGQALVEKSDEPIYLVTKTETIEYSSPILMELLGSYLKAGPGPVDPLADARDTSSMTDTITGMLNQMTQMASVVMMQKAAAQQAGARVQQQPRQQPDGEVSFRREPPPQPPQQPTTPTTPTTPDSTAGASSMRSDPEPKH